MSAKNPAWRYLPTEQRRTSDEKSLMFDRANACESVIAILNGELGCGVPEHGEGKSWKFYCPWGEEHSDGGLDKAARYFWDTDHAYCFAGHDVLDVVTIRSLMWNVSKFTAARKLLTQYTEKRVPYAERLAMLAERVRNPATEVKPMSVAQAQQALSAALSALDGYTEFQYQPQVRESVARSLEALQPEWSLDEVLGWVEESCERVAVALGKESTWQARLNYGAEDESARSTFPSSP